MKKYEEGRFGEKLGIAVKKLRTEYNMSQEDLRGQAELGTGYISRLENGEYSSPSIYHIYKIAKAFDMTLRDLLEAASLIPTESSFEACLRGDGLDEEEINKIREFKQYVVFESKSKRKNSET